MREDTGGKKGRMDSQSYSRSTDACGDFPMDAFHLLFYEAHAHEGIPSVEQQFWGMFSELILRLNG